MNSHLASVCGDRGVVSAAFRNGMEDDSVWPRERYVRTVEPFCGSRTFELDGSRNKLTVYDSKKFNGDQIDLSLNPHVCFAYIGNIGNTIRVTIEAGRFKGVRTYDLGISPTEKWSYKCWDILNDFVVNDDLVQKKVSQTDGIEIKQIQLSTANDNLAYIDEFIIGRVEGFFEVNQVSIGARPSGYVKRIDAKWAKSAGKTVLRLEYQVSELMLLYH